MTTRTSMFALLLSFTGVLAACSGGGGGETGTTRQAGNPSTNNPEPIVVPEPQLEYSGNRQRASLELETVAQFLSSFISSQGSTELTTSRSNNNGTVSYTNDSQPIKLHSRIDVDETEVCTDGGTLQISGILNDITRLGVLDLVFNDCRLDNDILNGEALLEITAVDSSSGVITDATQIYNGTDLERNGEFWKIFGTERIEQGTRPDRDPSKTTLNYLIRNQNSGKEIWFDNFVSETVFGFDDTPPTRDRISTESGRIYFSSEGYVEISTTRPLVESRRSGGGPPYEASNYPVYQFDGSQGQQARLTYNETSVVIEINGDGITGYELSTYVPSDQIEGFYSSVGRTNDSAPVAKIRSRSADSKPVLLNETLPLNSSVSTDEDLNPLNHQWRITEMPANSELAELQIGITDFSFVPDVIGKYTITLTVDDGEFNSSINQSVVVYDFLPENDSANGAFSNEQMVVRAYSPFLDSFLVKVPQEGVREEDYRLLGQYGIYQPETGSFRLLNTALSPLVYVVASSNSNLAVFIDDFPGSFNDSDFLTVVNLENGDVVRTIELNTEENNSFGCCISAEVRGNTAYLLMQSEFTSRAVAVVNLDTGAISINNSAPYGDVAMVTSATGEFFITLREQNNYPLQTTDELGPQQLITLRRYSMNNNNVVIDAELQYGFESDECSTFNDLLYLTNNDTQLSDECGRAFPTDFQTGTSTPSYFYSHLKNAFNNTASVFDSERHNSVLIASDRGAISAYSRTEDSQKFVVTFEGVGGGADAKLYESPSAENTYYVGGGMSIASTVRF